MFTCFLFFIINSFIVFVTLYKQSPFSKNCIVKIYPFGTYIACFVQLRGLFVPCPPLQYWAFAATISRSNTDMTVEQHSTTMQTKNTACNRDRHLTRQAMSKTHRVPVQGHQLFLFSLSIHVLEHQHITSSSRFLCFQFTVCCTCVLHFLIMRSVYTQFKGYTLPFVDYKDSCVHSNSELD